MKALVASLREIFRSSGEYIEKNPAKEAMINVQVSKESVFESLLQVKIDKCFEESISAVECDFWFLEKSLCDAQYLQTK